MIDYIKKNHLGLLIIAFLIASSVFGAKTQVRETPVRELGAINRDTTTVSNPFTFQQGVTIDSNANGTGNSLTVSGTTTIAKSPDGFVLWDDFTVATTTPVRAAMTNSGSPLMCDGDSLAIYSDATAAFAPSFKFAVGVATAATSYAADLTASTTVATTTDTITAGASAPFLVASGSSITLSVGDYDSGIASSTYYGNWSGQISVHCWTLGQ